jgi:8-oxo-dGTP pyrophosphatase MutT (NUDIX family)
MPVEPAPAATVILLRDGAVSPEVLMIERHSKSEFLPDMYVFPGGRVEDEDHALAERLTGIDRARAADLIGTVPPDTAAAFFVAAIRETFEESGILLARRRGRDELLDGAEAADLSRHRLEVQDGSASFRELVEKHDMELAGDALAVHGHWITPETVPRRFDTVFFAAVAPPGQRAAHDGVEATDHLWVRPEDALEQMAAGQRRIIFPTACNLETLRGFASAPAAQSASHLRPVVAVLPVLEERDGKRRLVIPADAGYSTIEELLESSTRPPK